MKKFIGIVQLHYSHTLEFTQIDIQKNIFASTKTHTHHNHDVGVTKSTLLPIRLNHPTVPSSILALIRSRLDAIVGYPSDRTLSPFFRRAKTFSCVNSALFAHVLC